MGSAKSKSFENTVNLAWVCLGPDGRIHVAVLDLTDDPIQCNPRSDFLKVVRELFERSDKPTICVALNDVPKRGTEIDIVPLQEFKYESSGKRKQIHRVKNLKKKTKKR